MLSIHALAHILIGEPVSTSPGYALASPAAEYTAGRLESNAAERHYGGRYPPDPGRSPMAVAENLIAPADDLHAPRALPVDAPSVRPYFVVLSLIGLAAFVLGVGNRFTADSPFLVAPRIDWIPPLSAGPWNEAYSVHQQDPVFASCGGTESLSLFKMLYWWEWLRQASLLGLGGIALIGLGGAALWRRFAFALPRLVGLAALALAYWPARATLEFAIGASPTMSSFNAGQYRHAVDVVFASAAFAGAIASAAAPPRPDAAARRRAHGEWLWVAAILIDIGFGALFAARDAAASWPSWLGYEGHALPPLGQLVSYSPWWLNFTFNALTIQLVHRALSAALWIAAAWQLAAALRRAMPATRTLLRFALITAQMLLGIATLALGVPAVLSIVHQVAAVVLLAASLAFLASGEENAPAGIAARRKTQWRTA